MRIEKLTSDKEIQGLILDLAKRMHPEALMEEQAWYFREMAFYSLVDKRICEIYLKELKRLAYRLTMNGTMGNAVRDINFTEDLKANPNNYVRFLVEYAIDKAYNRQVGEPEEKNLEGLLAAVKGSSFKCFYHRIVFIRSQYLCNTLRAMDYTASKYDDGIVAYGYIDTKAGLSFKALCCGNLAGNRVNMSPMNSDSSMTIRFNSLGDAEFLDLLETNADMFHFEEIIELTKHYDAEKALEETRNLSVLNPSRHPAFPDDIGVLLIRNYESLEKVWVRCIKMDTENGFIYGKLLNEPYNDFGIHCGDIIPFRTTETEAGEILCIFLENYLV